MIGRVIKDLYQVERHIGEGGPSIVYQGRDLLLEMPVAVKMLRTDDELRLVNPERFLREARTQAKLVHQNIVAIRAIIEENQQYFIVMEYIDGVDLERLILTSRRNPRLSLAEVNAIFQQALAGLGYAHSMGVVHRDIKPSNVMVTRDGVVKLADFGIARNIEDNRLTQTGAVIGSPIYMSPEQCRGLNLDRRSDVYSAGIAMFEALVGTPPFPKFGRDSQDLFELMRCHIMEPPPSFASLGVEVPKSVEAVLHRSLSKDPDARFSSCEAFAAALQSSLVTEGISLQADLSSMVILQQTGKSSEAAISAAAEPTVRDKPPASQKSGAVTGPYAMADEPAPDVKEFASPKQAADVEQSADIGAVIRVIPDAASQEALDAAAMVDLQDDDTSAPLLDDDPPDKAQAPALGWLKMEKVTIDNRQLTLFLGAAFVVGILVMFVALWLRKAAPSPGVVQAPLRPRSPSSGHPKRAAAVRVQVPTRAPTLVGKALPKADLQGRIPSQPKLRVAPIDGGYVRPAMRDTDQPPPRRSNSGQLEPMGSLLDRLVPSRRVAALPPPGSSGSPPGFPDKGQVSPSSTRVNAPALPPSVKYAASMVPIKGGCFWQGAPPARAGRAADHAPKRKVCVDGFWLDRLEVSVSQYRMCMRSKGACRDMSGYGVGRVKTQLRDEPIHWASWADAGRYCRWAGKRLPSEAEWERAARGEDQRIYPWGEQGPHCGRAQFNRCSSHSTSIGPKIRTKGASFFGVLDMAGSVSEWVMDCYDPRAYELLGSQNPLLQKPGCKAHVLRGGGWTSSSHQIRSFAREQGRGRKERYGIRCAWGPTVFRAGKPTR